MSDFTRIDACSREIKAQTLRMKDCQQYEIYGRFKHALPGKLIDNMNLLSSLRLSSLTVFMNSRIRCLGLSHLLYISHGDLTKDRSRTDGKILSMLSLVLFQYA